MPDRTKDGPKARHDLEFMQIRNDLHVGHPDDDDEEEEEEETEGRRKGRKAKRNDYHSPASCFTLSPQEIEQFFNCLLGVKVPYGYSGKISRYLDKAEQKFSGDDVSRLSRVDDADTSGCNPRNNGRARPSNIVWPLQLF
jgi:hypothetical protein